MTTAAGASEPVTASPSARTISGRIVPFGPAGQTSQGRLTFGAGALRWTDPRRVKLLLEHDQRQAVGFALELEERADGIYGTFSVPEHPLGDTALLEATHGLRDAFSVGVQLDDAAATRLRRSQGAPAPGSGALREVSLVSVPAFDDARVDGVAATSGALVVSAWSETIPEPAASSEPVYVPADPAEPVPALPVTPHQSPPRTPEPVTPPVQPVPEGQPMPEILEPVAPAAPAIPVQPTGPTVVQAAAGAALVTGEPATYTFSGSDGPSIVHDAMYATSDPNAAARLARYNAELATGNPASIMALAAVATRDTLSELVNPSIRRPDLLLSAINRGRPVWERLGAQTITNAQPFLIPVEGEFTGVGPHTEGTAHVAEGTLTFSDVTVTPRAVSGAYRISRELADSSTPAADAMIVAAMLRNYAEVSEGLAVDGLIAGAGAAVAGINTVAELRGELIDYAGDNGYSPDVVVAGSAFYAALATEVAGDGRPALPFLAPMNAAGTIRAGYTGAVVDGVEIARSRAVATGEAYVISANGVLVAESPVQVFRFEQPEGPGIIKLALFAYQVAAVTRAGSVRRLATV